MQPDVSQGCSGGYQQTRQDFLHESSITLGEIFISITKFSHQFFDILRHMSQHWYDHQQIEPKWQQVWEEMKLFQQTERQEIGGEAGDPLYLLFAFAYPSGSGLHVGHVESKTALDILARYYRMQGKKVFFPVGWDAFGLPAENYAIKTGIHPAETTRQAIDTFRRQVKRLGISYDWANEIATSHPEYYRWTQWIFLQLYKQGLAYRGIGMVNWCPGCQTVLANEQVVEGACERCGSKVIQKEMEQWFFKITEYKDELISGLDQVDWPEATKHQQLNWIGKKEGAIVKFDLAGSNQQIDCFTTRVDTVFGATFVVMSPEKFRDMELAAAPEQAESVAAYIEKAFQKTEEERQIGEKDKTGVDTELKVINPVNGAELPLYVADYVLGSYGTGAVMGVPAHDVRDFEFAKRHGLEVIQVIDGGAAAEGSECFTDYGKLVNSGKFDGMSSEEAMEAIPADFEEITPETTYRLRDWLISRQRYWGAPIPIVYDPEGNPHPVKEEHLPWLLPTDVDFKPTGESPLRSSKEFIERTERLYGPGWRPEFDTMDTFVDSSWYYLRYVDSRNQEALASQEQLEKWLPVDFYMIGPEHIVLHLLYSRFFTKFLRDQGYLKFDEPFMKMRHQGMILGPDGRKMSKSKGNVINPDEVIEKFGADTLRIYEMFMGPLDADKPWDVRAVIGVHKFLQRVNRLVFGVVERVGELSESDSREKAVRKLHQTIRKVGEDLPALKFNTAVAALMEFINTWDDAVKAGTGLSKAETLLFVKTLAPLAPYMAEELYHTLTGVPESDSVHLQGWPEYNEILAQADTIEIGVQVNGKLRGTVAVSPDMVDDQAAVLEQAKSMDSVQRYLSGKNLLKEIYVPGRIVSFVVGE